MKRFIGPILSCLVFACNSDIEDISVEEFSEKTTKEGTSADTENNAPVIALQNYAINEHSKAGMSIGFIKASDEDGDEVTYTIDSAADFTLDEHTGELKVGTNLKLDYETAQNLDFKVSAFDGLTITEKEFALTVEDVDETTMLTKDQKELITYFQHLVFWKGASNSSVRRNQKWGKAMKLYLDGTISETYRANVESVIAQYNVLFTDGDFSISLVENQLEANATLFFGTKNEVENYWPDMYKEIKDGNYDGFAMTPSTNSILVSTRIWISNPLDVLFKHELGHALGFGHSNKCDDEHSFLCSQISSENDFLPVEKEIIRLMYNSELSAGLSESEIEMFLANLILKEE